MVRMNDVARVRQSDRSTRLGRVAMVEQQAQHTMGLSEGYVPSRLDSRLSEDGVLQNLTWNDTRSRIQVRWGMYDQPISCVARIPS